MKNVRIIENGMKDKENMPKTINRGAVLQINSVRTDSNYRHTPKAYVLVQTDVEQYQLISLEDGNRWGKPFFCPFNYNGLSIDSDNLMKHIGEYTCPPIAFEVCYIAPNVQEMYMSVAQKAIASMAKL